MAKAKPLEDMNLAELREEEARLAAAKKEIRVQQNAVAQMIAFRAVTETLPPGLAERVRLEGGLKTEGGAS